MKLNWLRAGCESIAEFGELTFATRKYDKSGKYCLTIRDNDGGELVESQSCFESREAAESACEAWLDQHDKPVWNDATEWLSWAEWRGFGVVIHRYQQSSGLIRWCFDCATSGGCEILKSRDDAKSAAEKYVRDKTA